MSADPKPAPKERSSRMFARIESRSRENNVIFPADLLQRVGSDFEQLRPAISTHLPGGLQVRLEADKSVIPAAMQVNEYRLELPVAFAGRDDFAAADDRVLHVNVHGVRLERRPVVERFVAAL